MKQILLSIVLFLRTYSVFAGNLCDAECSLSITFPDGGSIVAVEPLTFVYSEGGYINDGIVTTGYASGESRSLAAGESIEFQSGGALDVGVGGNLEYTSILIATNGVIDATANGGSEKIFLREMRFIGELTFVLHSDTEVVETGLLAVQVGSEVTLSVETGAGLNIAGGSIFNNSTQSINTVFSGIISVVPVPSTTSVYVCGPTSTGTLTNSGTISGGSISASAGGSSSTSAEYGSTYATASTGTLTNSGTISASACPGDEIISGTTYTYTTSGIPGDLTEFIIPILQINTTELQNFTLGMGTLTFSDPIREMSIEELINYYKFAFGTDGLELVTSDGESCTTIEGSCYSAKGIEYTPNDEGVLVKVETSTVESSAKTGAGELHLKVLFIMLFALVTLRRKI